MGVLNAAGLAAFLAVGLPAGAWVDRWLKRKTMITAELVRMAAMSVVPVLWWSGNLQIWHLYLIAAAAGTATVFFDVAYQSYVPVLVDCPAGAGGQLQAGGHCADSAHRRPCCGWLASGAGLRSRVVRRGSRGLPAIGTVSGPDT